MSDDKVGAVLVVGGGISGMQSSLDLADSGFKVYLIEKQGRLGGQLNNLTRVYPANLSAFELARTMVEKIKASRVEVMPSTEINSITGFLWVWERTVLNRPNPSVSRVTTMIHR